jgi:lysophospholipase L1-like esterase
MFYLRLVSVALLLSATGVASARAGFDCSADPAVWGGSADLSATERALRERRTLTVVALGSSSTEGIGATSAAHAYPAQLAALLRERFPGVVVEVVNRGIGGETAAQNLVRLDRDVLGHAPDLVIWQVSTNDALQGVTDDELTAQLAAGIARLRAAGADVMLLGPQPLPRPDWAAAIARVRGVLRRVADATGTPLLSRHRLMTYWQQSGRLSPAALIGPDGLHMTDASYRCLAERLLDLFPADPALRRAAALPASVGR